MKIELKKHYKYIVVILLLLFLIQVNWSMRYKSYNRDTCGKNILGGYLYLKHGFLIGEDDFEEINIFPLGMLHNLPLVFMADFGRNRTEFIEKYASTGEWVSFYKWGILTDNQIKILREQYRRDPVTENSKLPFIPRRFILWDVFALSLFGCLLGYLVFKWSREIYGLKSGLLALFLYSFSPWMISLSRLITSDLMLALVVTFALYRLWKFMKESNLKNSIITGVTLGIALATKITAAYCVIMFALIFIIFGWKIKINIKEKIKHFFIIMIIALFVLNTLFLCHDMFQTLENHRYPTYSNTFRNLEKMPVINKIPLPVPYKYIATIDATKAAANAELGPHASWLNGKGSSTGFRSFYFYSMLYKNTIPELIFFVVAILLPFIFFKMLKLKFSTLYLLFIFLFIFIFTSLTLKMNIGGRHIAPLFPIMFIIGSNFINIKLNKKFIIPIIIFLLLGWQLISVITIFPHHTAYFNEIAGGPEMGHTHFKDSNIDYDQDDLLVKWYFEKHPDIDLVPPCYGFIGKVVMNVEFMNFQMPNCFYWLKQFKPIDYIGYSWIVYEVDGEWYQTEDGKIGFNPSEKMLKRKY
ncbi:MAG: glycosyltransferase family 39 protein [Nanoarchaeota archaeon]|nr:glycosyltransferase family 39 protein [Nanoarchaeota archaeon]